MLRRFLPGLLLTIAGIVAVSALAQATEGRWKLDMGVCYFDSGDIGPDQCTPTGGRWKLDANGGCYFDSTDTGENQCAPYSPGESSESEVATSEVPVGADRADQ